MKEGENNKLPKELVQTLTDRLGKSIYETPFSSLKDKVIQIYQEAFLQSGLGSKVYYIEGKVVSYPKFYRDSDSVTFYIVNNNGEKISVFVPQRDNLLNYVTKGNTVGLKGRLHFYKDGILNGFDYIQFRADEVRNTSEIRKDYAPLLQYVRDNKKKKSLKFYFKKAFKIGLITSESSEAITDIEKNLGHRNFYEIEKHFVNLYQPEEIARKINEVDSMGYDLILIARGGLNRVEIFNDYRILNAIFESSTLVVTAIGHASFSSLSDVVADYSYDTPSVAALSLTQKKTDYNRKRNNLLLWSFFVSTIVFWMLYKLKVFS